MIKQNIKMRVTPEQSRKVQEVCFNKGVSWVSGADLKHFDEPFIFINDDHSLGYMGIDEVEVFLEEEGEEIDADLFIRTNGTCENTALNDDKVIKQNIKMRVTPEQSRKVQEICFEGGVEWLISCKLISYLSKPCLIIENYTITYRDYGREFEHNINIEEIDADLFIRTNGTCEEESTLNDDDIQRNIIFAPNADEYLKQKIVNLHDQLNKYRKNIQNQKEELTRLLAQNEGLKHKLNGVTNLVELSIQNDDLWAKELKEKDAIIKYLENKLDI